MLLGCAFRVSLFFVLRDIELDLARQCQAAGCPHCGGSLHFARYSRKPRGMPDDAPAELCVRLGLCCSRPECRRRTLPPSCVFMGRRVYWAGAVVLVTALRQQRTAGHSYQWIRATFGVSQSTVRRWLAYFRDRFALSETWQRVRGRVGAQVHDGALPLGLLVALVEATGDQDQEQGLVRCLRLLSG